MGSDESHFNVWLIVRDKITRQCPKTTSFWRERRAEAVSSRGLSAYQTNALPLGQTGSQKFPIFWPAIRQADPLTVGLLRVNRKPEQMTFVLKLCVDDDVTWPTGVYFNMSSDLIVNHYASFILIFVRHWSMLRPVRLSVWFALVGGLSLMVSVSVSLVVPSMSFTSEMPMSHLCHLLKTSV